MAVTPFTEDLERWRKETFAASKERDVPFTNPLIVATSQKACWVRIKDGAGHWSKWYATA